MPLVSGLITFVDVVVHLVSGYGRYLRFGSKKVKFSWKNASVVPKVSYTLGGLFAFLSTIRLTLCTDFVLHVNNILYHPLSIKNAINSFDDSLILASKRSKCPILTKISPYGRAKTFFLLRDLESSKYAPRLISGRWFQICNQNYPIAYRSIAIDYRLLALSRFGLTFDLPDAARVITEENH